MRKTIYSSVHPTLKNRLLIRGTCFGACGAGILLAFAVWSNEAFLTKYGLLIFAVGIGCISVGMIPLRRIQRLETQPDRLSVTPAGLVFEKVGKAPLELYLHDILRTQFRVRGDVYGIEVMTRTLKTFFFPYFTERSANTLLEYIVHGQEPGE